MYEFGGETKIMSDYFDIYNQRLNRYGIDGKTFVKNNPKVVSRCKYDDVVSALDFLIDELSVSPRNILTIFYLFLKINFTFYFIYLH